MSQRIVMTIPTGWQNDLLFRVPGLLGTSGALAELFETAKTSLKVMVPYIDPTFTALLAKVLCPVKVVTTPAPGRPARPNPVLERCSTMCDLAVRYLNERRDRALLFQMHAKLILADDRIAYVGSANLTDTSVHYNLELGVLVEDARVAFLDRIFDFFFAQGVRAGDL